VIRFKILLGHLPERTEENYVNPEDGCLLGCCDNRPDNEVSKSLWNVGLFLGDYTAQHPRTLGRNMFLDLCPSSNVPKNTTFRKLDPFPSSGEVMKASGQWLRLALSKGPNRVGAVITLPQNRNRSSFRNVVFRNIRRCTTHRQNHSQLIPEGCHLHTRRRVNLISHYVYPDQTSHFPTDVWTGNYPKTKSAKS
jgi:hypothetical protein